MTADQPLSHKPAAVTDTDEVKILWDFEIRRDRIIPVRRPDILVLDKQKKKVTKTDVSIPVDRYIKKRKTKSQNISLLKLENQKLWDMIAEVVPVVKGALGAVNANLEGHLQLLPGDTSMRQVAK